MPPDNGPVTKADLNHAIQSIQRLIENELKHQTEDITELKDWRNQFFVVEGGPWRLIDKRVSGLEYLARSLKWVIVALSPIALWAITEMIKAGASWIRGIP